MNLAEKAITSAIAARLTTETREKVSVAMGAVEGEREMLLVDALGSAVEALDALTSLLLDARDEASS